MRHVLASLERMQPFGVMHRFRRLPTRLRRLVVRASWLVPLVRLGLWLLPFGRVRGLVVREPATGVPLRMAAERDGVVHDVVWTVVAVSRRVPRASCLTQALVAQRLLAEVGVASDLRIGVARDATGAFEAHAWLEHDGRVVLGEVDGMERFTPMSQTGGMS